MGGRRIFLKTFRTSLFNDDLSNEPNFGRIHLDGQCTLKNRDMPPPAVFAGRGHPADNPPLLPALSHPEYLSPRKEIVTNERAPLFPI